MILPESLLSIEYNGFYNCNSLEKIDLSNVQVIGNNALSGCSKLKEINLTSCENIGITAFAYTSIQHVFISTKLTTTGSCIFKECANLVIYCESDFVEFDDSWNKYNENSSVYYDVKYGYTYEQYLAEVNA